MIKKRAVFFSTDALVALVIIFIIVLVAFPFVKQSKQVENLHYDILNVLSSLKMGDLNLPQYTTNSENKVLEQMGEFYATGQIERARDLAGAVLTKLDTNENVGIWYENTLIWSKNSTAYNSSVKNIDTARQTISGIQNGTNVTGFSARAFLTGSNRNKYFYFGGYVGDGNITARVEYDGNISSAEIELAINRDFEILVNNNSQGIFLASVDYFTPVNYSIPVNDFVSGVNTIEIRGDKLFIAGGFIRIIYNSEVEYQQPNRYYFPGIDGLINLYDGFYIPGDLNSLNINLHLDTDFVSFLNVGNVTVFNQTTDDEQTIFFDNNQLKSVLDYDTLEHTTVPLRFGLENVNISGIVNVFSVTDLSGSMEGEPLIDAKSANDLLIDIILNTTDNKIGLVGYDTVVFEHNYHTLSNDSISLHNKVSDWSVGANTCICCGINRAIGGFQSFYKIKSRISQSSDDAEERVSNGNMNLVSSDLEMVIDNSLQEVGLRFQNINIPQGSIITSAYIEFEADESDNTPTNLNFYSHNTDNSPTFSNFLRDITSRVKTSSKITWSDVPAWNIISEKHKTPDLSVIIQEVIDRSGWSSGNAITVIVNGTGKRVAESFNGENQNAPLLVVDYRPLECGNGILDSTEECDDGNNENGDGCSSICGIEKKLKAMVVMSDGWANKECSEQNTGNATQDAIQAACDAYQKNNITVHSVGFGNFVDEVTLQEISACGNGIYYYADIGDLVELYQDIAQDIITASYIEQTIEILGDISTKLFPDSYIEFNYTKQPNPLGLIIGLEKNFDDENGGTFEVFGDTSILNSQVVSYSGPRWTDTVKINDNKIYDIKDYGNSYVKLGDPYVVGIPNSFIVQNNFVNLTTGNSPQNITFGSPSNKIIYQLVKNVSVFSQISYSANGCNWDIQFEDDSHLITSIPGNYTGNENCNYNTENGQSYNQNDAFQIAVFKILDELDLDDDDKVDVSFTRQDIQISVTEIIGIPFTWSTEIQARIWK